MKKVLLLSLLFAATFTLVAQQKVALQSNGVTTIFGGAAPFVDAYAAAVDGDTIYLPGVTLAVPSEINKKLAIFGAGHYPDSTTATNKTTLSGNLTIKEDADSLFLTGFELTGTITFYTNHQVTNVVISRCKLNNITFSGTGATPCTNVTIKECVLSNINFSNATSCMVTNNILTGGITNGSGNAFYNNVFIYYVWKFQSITNCFIANNVFTNTSYLFSGCSSNTFSNNIFTNTPSPGTNTFVNNYNNVSGSVMVNQSGGSFSYTHDYHLTTPASYPGTDSTQVGIYGGIFPYKTAAVPLNPHISSQTIPMATDVNGMLNININVNAQDD
jgi:hypothetical protein